MFLTLIIPVGQQHPTPRIALFVRWLVGWLVRPLVTKIQLTWPERPKGAKDEVEARIDRSQSCS